MKLYDKICENKACNKKFQSKYFRSRFCSRSCSNQSIIRRKKQISICRYNKCNNETDHYTNMFCRDCISIGRHTMVKYDGKLYDELTLKEYCKRSGANRYDNVRYAARKSIFNIDNQKCEKCGWNHHVEVAHKIPIHSFSEDTLISKVNDRSNLILLCPNCHWLYDNR